MLAKRGWVVLLLLVLAAYFYGLGSVPLLGPDEPRYAQVAREMFERGDLVTPTLGGHTWFEKPALLYWVMMLFYAAFGATEFAARAGSALSGVLTVAAVGWMARMVGYASGMRLRGLGMTCALVIASSAGLLVFSHAATFDILLTATLTLAVACFFASELERDDGRRRLLLAGFYAFMGASLLAKGLVGVVLPVGIVVFYYLLRRRFPNPFRLGMHWGMLLTLAVAAAWYAPAILRHGWEFVDEFFLQHHFARYTSNKYHHPQPFYFYLPIILMLALPWTFFLVRGLWALREMNWHAEDAESKLRALATAWLAVPLVFFSLSGSKLPGYILPALPAAAIFAGLAVLRYLRGGGERGTMKLTGALALTLFVAGVAHAVWNFAMPEGAGGSHLVSVGCVVAVVMPAGACGLLALFYTRNAMLAVASVAGATLLTVVLISGCALDEMARHETMKPLLEAASAQGYGGLPVLQLHGVERTSEFYAAGRVMYDANGQPRKFEGVGDLTAAVRSSGGRALVVVPPEHLHQLTNDPGLETGIIGDNGSYALVVVRAPSP